MLHIFIFTSSPITHIAECLQGWQACNPLVLTGNMLTDDLADLLGARFRGDNPLLQLFDEALRDSVLLAPQ